jgi:hypothetical protein
MNQKTTTRLGREIGYTAMILSVVFIGIFSNVNAQNIIEVKPLEKLLQDNSLKGTSYSLKELCFSLIPTVYLKQGESQIKATEAPVRIITDVSSFSNLYADDDQFKSIEILLIQINSSDDLEKVLDLNSLKSFTSLHYIYFCCSFEICSDQNAQCEIQSISNMLKGHNNPSWTVTYTSNVNE